MVGPAKCRPRASQLFQARQEEHLHMCTHANRHVFAISLANSQVETTATIGKRQATTIAFTYARPMRVRSIIHRPIWSTNAVVARSCPAVVCYAPRVARPSGEKSTNQQPFDCTLYPHIAHSTPACNNPGHPTGKPQPLTNSHYPLHARHIL